MNVSALISSRRKDLPLMKKWHRTYRNALHLVFWTTVVGSAVSVIAAVLSSSRDDVLVLSGFVFAFTMMAVLTGLLEISLLDRPGRRGVHRE